MKSCLRVAFFVLHFYLLQLVKLIGWKKENFDGYDYIKNVIYGKIIQIKKGERKFFFEGCIKRRILSAVSTPRAYKIRATCWVSPVSAARLEIVFSCSSENAYSGTIFFMFFPYERGLQSRAAKPTPPLFSLSPAHARFRCEKCDGDSF